MRALVTVFGTDGLPVEPMLVREGEYKSVTIKSTYLVSAGQRIVIGLTVHDPIKATSSKLLDGRRAAGVVIPRVWDQSYIPTERPLSTILEAVVSHGDVFPGHGTDCVCMDDFIRELSLQMSKAIPPDTGIPYDVHLRLDARARIRYLLQSLERKL